MRRLPLAMIAATRGALVAIPPIVAQVRKGGGEALGLYRYENFERPVTCRQCHETVRNEFTRSAEYCGTCHSEALNVSYLLRRNLRISTELRFREIEEEWKVAAGFTAAY